VGFGPRGDALIRFTGASLVGVDPLDPHSDKSQWWLVARVRSHVAGQVATNGIRITYAVGIRSGAVTFPYRTVSDCAAQ
jgi:hypothetical protein